MRQKRRSSSEWQDIVGEFGMSGLTRRQFAEKRGLKVKTLEYRINRLRRESGTSAANPVRFVPVQMRTPTAEDSMTITDRDGHETIEVVVGAGLRVRFEAGVNCEYMGDLVEKLARSRAC